MNRPIRKVSIAMAVLFLAMFVNLNVVQVFKGSQYRDHQGNDRVLLNEYASPRGQIVVSGNNVAYSKASSDELKYLRVYANGPMYAPVTGYYSFIYGSSAIEDAENPVLSGDSAKLFTEKLTGLLTGRNPKGGSVQLTINKAAQEAAYNGMRIGKTKFKRGAVVALDPKTGAILAMVSTPSYDPNTLASHNADKIDKAWKGYLNDKDRPLLNRALDENYPAGSIFKIIDTAAALRLNITASTRIPAPNGYRVFDKKNTRVCSPTLNEACVENFGGETCQDGKTATLAFALAKSCNTAFAALTVDRIGADDLARQARLFGFDTDPPQVPMVAAPSTIGPLTELRTDPAALAQTSFGQRNVRVTPLQAAMLSAAVANNGLLMKPYLVAQELGPNLSTLMSAKPTPQNQVLDPNLDGDLIKMMEGVVSSREGTGGPAAITDMGPDVVVGGKTGTADVGATSASKIAPDAWFTGFAMVKGDPRIAVAVIVENGGVRGNETTGGQAAGPIARNVMRAYLKSVHAA